MLLQRLFMFARSPTSCRRVSNALKAQSTFAAMTCLLERLGSGLLHDRGFGLLPG
jgi:hypothetical protein